MGYNGHIRSKSIIEYKKDGYFGFTNCSEELEDFIKQECPSAVTTDLWGDSTSDWEIPIDEAKAMVQNLKENWDPNEHPFINHPHYTIQDIINFFTVAIEVSEKSENYSWDKTIYIDWF